MAIADSFNRPKAATTLTESLSLSAEIAEDGANKRWIVDILQTVNANVKTIFRVYIPYSVSGTSLSIDPTSYIFPGSATTYSAGGATPPVSEGSLGKSVDIDAFFTAGGDVRVNS